MAASPPYYIFLSAPDLTQANNAVKVVSPEGNYLGNLFPPGSGGLFGPDGLSLGANRNLFVGTVVNANVLEYQPLSGNFVGEFITSSELIAAFSTPGVPPSTLLRTTPLPTGVITLKATYGELGAITGLTHGPNGNLYVSNFESLVGIASFGQPVVHFDVQDSVIEFDGTTGAFVRAIPVPTTGATTAPAPEGVLVPDPNFSTLFPVQSWLDAGNIPNASLPLSLSFGPDGNLYIPTRIHDTVYRYDVANDTVAPFIARGAGGLNGASAVAFADNKVFVTSLDSNQILRYNLDGTPDGVCADFNTPALQGLIDGPTALKLTPDNGALIFTVYNTVATARIDVSCDIDSLEILTGPGGNPSLGFLRNSGLLVATPRDLGGDLPLGVPEPSPVTSLLVLAVVGISYLVKRTFSRRD